MAGNQSPNNHMHSDNKKRRSFVAMLFAAGDVGRYVLKINKGTIDEF